MAFKVGDRVVWDGCGMSAFYGPGPFVVEGTEPLSGPCACDPEDRAQVQITVRDGDVTERRSFAASWFKLAESEARTVAVKPAVGQTWQNRYGIRTIRSIDGDKVRWQGGGWDYAESLGEGRPYTFVQCRHNRVDKCAACALDAVTQDAQVVAHVAGPVRKIGDMAPSVKTSGRIVFQNVAVVGDPGKLGEAIRDAIRETWGSDVERRAVLPAYVSASRECSCNIPTSPNYAGECGRCGGVIDPRAERERRRREIDAVLAEDARRFPAFATARRAAVMAACESVAADERRTGRPGIGIEDVRAVLEHLRAYEDLRGGMTKPSATAHVHWLIGGCVVGAYERARGCK